MKVFVTGASGFIGSAIVQELLSAGHQVIGLARSDDSAKTLTEKGIEVLRGNLEDLESLKKGAEKADGVIHTAFIHDFSNFAAAAATDKAAIEAMGSVLKGSNRPLLVTGGTAGLQPGNGNLITEDDAAPAQPRASESAAIALANSGINASAVRLPPSVHGVGDHHGFVPTLIKIAREKGVAAYVGEGNNRWPAVHCLDAARLFRLAIEKGAGGMRYNGIGDEGIFMHKIAEVIGQHLNVPVASKSLEEADAHFGWISRFSMIDAPSSNLKTKEFLGWEPIQTGLLEDVAENYFK